MDKDLLRLYASFLTYPQLYCAVLVLVFLLCWAITGFIALALRCIFKSLIKNQLLSNVGYPSRIRDAEDPQNHSYYENPHSNEFSLKEFRNNKPSDNEIDQDSSYSDNGPINKGKGKIIRYIESTLSWLSNLSFSAALASLSAFDIIPIWLSILLVFIILSHRLTYTFDKRCSRVTKRYFRHIKSYVRTWRKMLHSHRKIFWISLGIIVSISLLGPLSTYKSCFNDHVEGYGIPLLGGKIIYSSALWRYLTLPKVCGDEAPCHIYATVPFNTSSSVFINVHTNIHVKQITVNYGLSKDFGKTATLPYAQPSSFVSRQDYDLTGERNIHTVLLNDLEPDQLYTIEIFYNGKTQAFTSYQTLPGEDSENSYNLIYGGDAGYTPDSVQIAKTVAEQDPRAIIIGGDIAYDDGSTSCYYSMDLFLSMIEKEIYAKMQRIVPMILGVGNHDVGFSSLGKMGLSKKEKEKTSFFINFPQNLPEDSEGKPISRVPNFKERKSYRTHMIGNLLNIFLDAAYVVEYGGKQSAWLRNVSESYKSYPKVAVYHDPIFPPCYKPYPLQNTTEEGVKNWVPIFTEYKFMAAFENHAHNYKRTFPLNGVEKSKSGIGTVYLGDGAWGPHGGSSCQSDGKDPNSIFQSYNGKNNIWVVKVDPKKKEVSYEPVGKDNSPIDIVTVQKTSDYIDL